MSRSCEHCGSDFPAKRADARFCGDRCRKRAARRRDREGTDAPSTVDPVVIEAHPLVKATQRELAEAEVLDTIDGQLALHLARQLARVAYEGGAGLTGLSSELRTVHRSALALKPPASAPEPEPEDEITRARRLREEKARQAAVSAGPPQTRNNAKEPADA